MKRIVRRKSLTRKEAARYHAARGQIAAELPELVARHHERTAKRQQVQRLLAKLKAARQKKRLSLADLRRLTGMDRSALSKLEAGQRHNPTVDTLVRYAEAVGLQVDFVLTETG